MGESMYPENSGDRLQKFDKVPMGIGDEDNNRFSFNGSSSDKESIKNKFYL